MEMSQLNSCIATINKQKCLLSKMENRNTSQSLSGGLYQWEGEDIRKEGRR
jgi:hypothetical protein